MRKNGFQEINCTISRKINVNRHFKLEGACEKGENAIPKLTTDLELNKLIGKRPKIMPNVLKHNTDKKFQTHIRGIRRFLALIGDHNIMIIL